MKADITSDNTYYVIEGEGEPLILLHGVGLDHAMWQSQIEYFSQYYQVFAYDMLGHGNSLKPTKTEYKLADFTEQLKNFMNDLGIPSAHILGFSMGGMVAQSFGINHASRVKSLIFSNAVAHRSETERASVQQRIEMVEADGKNSTIEPAIDRWFNNSFKNSHKAVINKIKQRLIDNDEESYLKAYKVFGTADILLWQDLCKIQAPVLVITGACDQGSNTRMAKEMATQIKNAQLVIEPEARHMLPLEKDQIFNDRIHEFLINVDEEVKNNY